MTAVNLDHELLRRAVAQPEVLHWQTWAALAPGPSLLVLGAVHGNEVCGAHGIVRAGGWVQLRNPTQGQNGQPLVMRLVIGDSVRLEVEGREQTMRIVKINGNNGQIFMAPVQEANVDARNSDKQDAFAYTSKYAGSMQKAKARQVTISAMGELRDPGFQG